MFDLRTRGSTEHLIAPEEFLNRVYYQALEFLMSDEDLFILIKYSYNAEMEHVERHELMAHPFDLEDNPYPLALQDRVSTINYATDDDLLRSYRALNLVVVDRRRGRFSIPPQREVW